MSSGILLLRMKRTKLLVSVAASLALGLVSVGTASADVTFDLSNVQLSTASSGGTPDGTLTGSFTTNNAFTSLTSVDIVASIFGSYTGQTYTLSNSTVTFDGLPNSFRLDTNPVGATSSELQLVFSSALTSSGATLSTSSYEHENSGGNRFVSSGSVVLAPATVPEPASAALIALALIPLALYCRRQYLKQ